MMARPERFGAMGYRGGPVDAVVIGDLNLLWPVVSAGLRAVFVPRNENAALSRRAVAVVRLADPKQNTERAANELAELGRALGTRPVLYYESDADLLMLSRFSGELGRHFRFLLPPEGLIDELLDKRRFQVLATRHGWPVPRELRDKDSLEFPCVIKPASRIGWYDSMVARSLQAKHKVIKVRAPDEFQRWTALMKQQGLHYLVQEYVEGGDDQLFSFHAFLDRRSRPLGWFVGKKVRTYPLNTGGSTCLELVEDKGLADLGLEILRGLEFRGVAKMDFKRDLANGGFRLFEINARFNLWHYLGAASGINLPLIAHRYLTGQPVDAARAYRPGLRWVSLRSDILAGLAGRREGRWSSIEWLRSYLWPAVYDGYSWRDPIPMINSIALWLRGLPGRLVPRRPRRLRTREKGGRFNQELK